MNQPSWKSAAKATGKGIWMAGKAAIKGTAATARAVATTVKNHEADIAMAGKTVTKLAGATVGAVGRGLDAAGSAAVHKLSESSQGAGQGRQVVTEALKVGAKLVSGTGKGAGYVAQGINAAGPAVGGTLGGVMTGATQTLAGVLDSAAVTESDIRALQDKLKRAGVLSSQRSKALDDKIHRLQQSRRRGELLDLLTIGGISLAAAAANPAAVPQQIQQAFEAAYPRLAAQGESFGDAVARMSSSELPGLVNGVKGKLFELQLVEQLNESSLPLGYQAELAESATQPGYDIVVTDPSGQVHEVLSAKATDSVEHVKTALEKYPDIQVTTTSEVHAQFVSIGLADGVVNSGITDAALQGAVEAAAAGDAGALQDLAPSAVGLAVIALSAFMDKSVSLEARGAEFGQRSAKVGVVSVAAKGALAATGFWWLGLAAGVGSGWLAGFGERKRLRYEAVKACSRSIDDLERRRRSALARVTT